MWAAMGKIGRTFRSPLVHARVARALGDGHYMPLGGVWSFECP